MKNNNENQIVNSQMTAIFIKAGQCKLSQNEKEECWKKIIKLTETSKPDQQIKSPYNPWTKRSSTIIGLGLIGIILLGGGLSVGAENALPGQILYPIKIGLNERIQIISARNSQELASINSNLASTRLAEAEKLLVLNSINQETLKSILNDFDKHTNVVTAEASTQKEGGNLYDAATLSSDLESVLVAHSKILNDMKQIYAENETQNTIASLSGELNKRLNDTTALRQNIESALIASTTDSETIKAAARRAELISDQMLRQAENSRSIYPNNDNFTSIADSELSKAREYRSQGVSKLIEGAYGEAIMLFSQAHRSADQAVTEISVGNEIKAAEKNNSNRQKRLKTLPEIKPVPISTSIINIPSPNQPVPQNDDIQSENSSYPRLKGDRL